MVDGPTVSDVDTKTWRKMGTFDLNSTGDTRFPRLKSNGPFLKKKTSKLCSLLYLNLISC